MEYYKVYCPDHPYELISNFCSDPACLVGLCATCICQHTAVHLSRGTPPAYENVKNTFTRFNDLLRTQINTIQQDKEWLNGICQTINDKRRDVKTTIRKAREDCLALVEKHFDQLEGKIDSQINNESKKNSLHSSYRLQTLNTLILKEVSSLLMYSKDLNSPKFLQTAKLMQQQVFPCSRDFHLRVSKQLKENQVYTASAVYRSDLLGDLSASLGRLINLQFLLPTVEYVQGPGRVAEVRRAHSVGRSPSAVIMIPRQELVSNRLKNTSAFLPKQSHSMLLSGNNSMPLHQIQQLMRNSDVVTPMMTKSSRLGSGLKIIRESKCESVCNDENNSMTGSSVSYGGKQNLAYSTYYDSGSNFYK